MIEGQESRCSGSFAKMRIVAILDEQRDAPAVRSRRLNANFDPARSCLQVIDHRLAVAELASDVYLRFGITALRPRLLGPASRPQGRRSLHRERCIGFRRTRKWNPQVQVTHRCFFLRRHVTRRPSKSDTRATTKNTKNKILANPAAS